MRLTYYKEYVLIITTLHEDVKGCSNEVNPLE